MYVQVLRQIDLVEKYLQYLVRFFLRYTIHTRSMALVREYILLPYVRQEH